MKILLFDFNTDRMTRVQQHMHDEGIDVVIADPHKNSLLEQLAQYQPEALMINIDPAGRSLLDAVREINRHQPLPIIIYSEEVDDELIDKAVKEGVGAFIVDDLTRRKLGPIIRVAMGRFSESKKLKGELEKTRMQLADRKDIDRAKAILMEQKQIPESEAFAALRKMAMNKNISIGEASRNIITVTEMLN